MFKSALKMPALVLGLVLLMGGCSNADNSQSGNRGIPAISRDQAPTVRAFIDKCYVVVGLLTLQLTASQRSEAENSINYFNSMTDIAIELGRNEGLAPDLVISQQEEKLRPGNIQDYDTEPEWKARDQECNQFSAQNQIADLVASYLAYRGQTPSLRNHFAAWMESSLSPAGLQGADASTGGTVTGATADIAAAAEAAAIEAAVAAMDASKQRFEAAAIEFGVHDREPFKDCDDCPDMVLVPPGSFMMGSPESYEFSYVGEFPQRLVYVPAFAAGKYEVTWTDYNACIVAGSCSENDSNPFEKKHLDGSTRYVGDDARVPATHVSWDDAQKYAAWLSGKTGKSYRLLTEAEWEYAARAGTTTAFSFGDTISRSLAHYDSTFPKPVGSYSPNAFGIFDMHGNAAEWVEDCYLGYSAGHPIDGRAVTEDPCRSRVVRGGSSGDSARNVRSAYRGGHPGLYPHDLIGFRVARTL